MFLPQNMLSALVHDAVLKQVAEVGYDIERIQGKTETGGLGQIGSVARTITTGGTAQIVTNWLEDYQEKVASAVIATGVITTTTGTTFTIDAQGSFTRSASTKGVVKMEIFSSKDGILASADVSKNGVSVNKFALTYTGALTATSNLISLRIVGETVTGETITLDNLAMFVESAA